MSCARDVSKHARKLARPAFLRALGLGMAFSAFFNVVRFSLAEDSLLGSAGLFGPHFLFVLAVGASLAVVGFGYATVVRARMRSGEAAPAAFETAIAAPGMVLGTLGLACLGLLITLQFVPDGLAVVAGALFGSGCALLFTAWAEEVVREAGDSLFSSGVAGALVCMLLCCAGVLLSARVAFGLDALAYLASCALLLRVRFASPAPSPTGDDAQSPTGDDAQKLADALPFLRRSLWMPFTGAVIVAFIFGLTWSPVLSGMHGASSNQGEWVPLLGAAALLAVACALLMRFGEERVARAFGSVAHPLAVAVLLVMPSVSPEVGVAKGFTETLAYTSFTIIVLSLWYAVATASKRQGVPIAYLFAVCVFALAAAFVTGFLAIAAIGLAGQVLCLVILALYLAVMVSAFALRSRGSTLGAPVGSQGCSSADEPGAQLAANAGGSHGVPGYSEASDIPDDARTYIVRRCEQLAREGGLSPREHEVLRYLARGFNPVYIAEHLYISENTVRTHVRRIYSKLQVGSREELIVLVDEPLAVASGDEVVGD